MPDTSKRALRLLNRTTFLSMPVLAMVFVHYWLSSGIPGPTPQETQASRRFLPTAGEVKSCIERPYYGKSHVNILDKATIQKLLPRLELLPRGYVHNHMGATFASNFHQEGILVLTDGRILWWNAHFAGANRGSRGFIEFSEANAGGSVERHSYRLRW